MILNQAFDQVVFITSAYGLGEMVVQGRLTQMNSMFINQLLAKGLPAIVRRNLGSKKDPNGLCVPIALSMVKQVRIEDTPEALRNRFSLTDDEVQELAKQAVLIEQHYGRPMDIEWAKDGHNGRLYIVQARPEKQFVLTNKSWNAIS